MNAFMKRSCTCYLSVALAVALMLATLAACSSSSEKSDSHNQTRSQAQSQAQNRIQSQTQSQAQNASHFIVVIEDEPDTVDFQCTSLYYTVAINVFNRLVETVADEDGSVRVIPSLAESWAVSDDGRRYTFHLRDGVTFSNGAELTSSDVLYSFTRLLTHPDSCNGDIVASISGAEKLANGETDKLEGFEVLSDTDFAITLEQPFGAFLPCLSMPGASIMDEATTIAAGDRFGLDSDSMIGTGPFILQKWQPREGMTFVANANCFEGPPNNDGLDLRFITEPEETRALFNAGELDVLDLDDVPDYAEYFIHGDIYQDRLLTVQRIALTYIALNESIVPLTDVRVRRALQLSLDRPTLLDAVYSGRGSIENGIFPQGLYGHNPQLPEIPFNPSQAKELLLEAGYPDGFDLTVSVRSSATQAELTLVRLAASMWDEIGVHTSIEVMGEEDFMRLRKEGSLACYAAIWTADYNDPDNFIYTFFGNRENTTYRSICYQRDDVMKRVQAARSIIDSQARLQEYWDLEQTIAQEDAAWIPLFSRQHIYVLSDRVDNVSALWNGSVKSKYRDIIVREAQ